MREGVGFFSDGVDHLDVADYPGLHFCCRIVSRRTDQGTHRIFPLLSLLVFSTCDITQPVHSNREEGWYPAASDWVAKAQARSRPHLRVG